MKLPPVSIPQRNRLERLGLRAVWLITLLLVSGVVYLGFRLTIPSTDTSLLPTTRRANEVDLTAIDSLLNILGNQPTPTPTVRNPFLEKSVDNQTPGG